MVNKYQILKKQVQIEPVQFSSVTQSCLTLCNPMDCSTPGFLVHHQLLELAQTHVHWVSDAIQPSHPLLSPSPPAFNLSQHQGLFQWVCSYGSILVKLKHICISLLFPTYWEESVDDVFLQVQRTDRMSTRLFYLFLAFLSIWPNELFFLLHMAFLCPWSSLSTKCPQLASIQCFLEQSSSFSTLWSAGPVLGQCGTNKCWHLWGE